MGQKPTRSARVFHLTLIFLDSPNEDEKGPREESLRSKKNHHSFAKEFILDDGLVFRIASSEVNYSR